MGFWVRSVGCLQNISFQRHGIVIFSSVSRTYSPKRAFVLLSVEGHLPWQGDIVSPIVSQRMWGGALWMWLFTFVSPSSLSSLMTIWCFISWTLLNSLLVFNCYFQKGCGQHPMHANSLLMEYFLKVCFLFNYVCLCMFCGAHGRQKNLLGLGPLELEKLQVAMSGDLDCDHLREQ